VSVPPPKSDSQACQQRSTQPKDEPCSSTHWLANLRAARNNATPCIVEGPNAQTQNEIFGDVSSGHRLGIPFVVVNSLRTVRYVLSGSQQRHAADCRSHGRRFPA